MHNHEPVRPTVQHVAPRLNRRTILGTLGSGLAVAVAGCTDSGSIPESVPDPIALNGESLVRWTTDETKERICGVLEAVREQNPLRRILLVLDKHGSHICEHTRKRAHQLGIDLVFLPSGSPHLNPIEQVWKQLKWTMCPIIVDNEAEFHELVKDVFEQLTQRVSFAKKWAEKFLDFQKLP